MKIKIAVGAGLLIGIITNASAEIANECAKSFADIESRFNTLLSSNDADRVNRAVELLRGTENCHKKTVEDKALLADMSGQICHLTYIYSREQSAFDCAFNAFNKAASLNTARNEKIYWHMARLMRSAGRYSEGLDYLNKVMAFHPKSEDVLPYLETGFQLVVDAKQWMDAKGLLEELHRRDRRFYADPELLLPSVMTFCHFKQSEEAKLLIQNVEENVNLDEQGKKLVQKSKDVLKNCT